ncbi:glycosyltransferase [Mesorhizobium sp. J428]|uniref:glycosyltransferase family 4 protein n=1 Tax=Mesorhizobium sp. J428 TaxID=2898440 RepID=UPI0021518195|nr:glycosyltransferase [Mesorhizobium sp. J428]MCR5858299.1 glycosyltransferase [Mesorhizobium sp. J428]
MALTRIVTQASTFNTEFYRQAAGLGASMNPLSHYATSGAELELPASPEAALRTKREDLTRAFDGVAPTSDRLVPVYLPGGLKRVGQCKSVLVVGHTAGKHFSGSERSFLDMLDGLAAIGLNAVAALPQDVPAYTAEVAKRACQVVIAKYGWWRDNPVSAETLRRFEDIIFRTGVDAVHVNTIMLREPLIAAANCGVPSIAHIRELITHDEALAQVIGETPERIVEMTLERADWIIANSRATAECFHKEGFTHVVPNTTDFEALDIPNIVDPSAVRFGIISSNLPKKGIDDVIELARACEDAVPNSRFVIIGPENTFIDGLKSKQVRGELPSNLTFAGYADTPLEAIRMTNVVLSFSHFAESFGRTALEGMAACRPVIAYEWGALPELVEHGSTGFLIPYRQPLAALDHVRELCQSPKLIAELGRRGREAALEKFSRTRYAERLASAYSTIFEGDWPADPDVGDPTGGNTSLSDDIARSASSVSALTQIEAETSGMLVDAGSAAGLLVKKARALADRRPAPETLKVAYFCWHFPVPSETFVLNELRTLVEWGYDVRVFCKEIPYKDFRPDFAIEWERVSSPEQFAERLRETGRTVVHAHFTYPTVTNMVLPACELAHVPFTFIAHAQDIFRYKNDELNRIGEIGRSQWCRRVLVPSKFHRRYIAERGVPESKIVINPNGIDAKLYSDGKTEGRETRPFRRVVGVHRFVEKKGLIHLVRAAKNLENEGIAVDIYGYGDLEDE